METVGTLGPRMLRRGLAQTKKGGEWKQAQHPQNKQPQETPDSKADGEAGSVMMNVGKVGLASRF
jgi:hypothetical protein